MASPSRFARPKVQLGLGCVAVALAAADTYVVVLALTDMMAGVGLGIESLQRATPIISGFLLGYVCVLPLVGRLADLVERHRVLLGALVVFVVGSGVTALAVELPVLVGGRFLQGLGGGGLVPATLALVADLWPVSRRGVPLGVVGAMQELGSVLGPVLGAVVLAVADWRAIFWLNALAGMTLWLGLRWAQPTSATRDVSPSGPVPGRSGPWGSRFGAWRLGGPALLLAVLTLAAPERLVTDVTIGLAFVPMGGSSRVLTPVGLVSIALLVLLALVTRTRWAPVLARADLPGATCVAVALGGLVLTFATADPEREVVGPLGWVLLPASAVAAGLLVWRHRVAAAPLVPRGVVRARVPWALAVSLLIGVALVAVVVDIPLLARLVLTTSATGSALVLVRFLVAVPIGALIGGWALHRVGPGVVAGAGLLVAGTGMLLMARWGRGSLDDAIGATAVLAAAGLGIGLTLAPVNAATLADAPDDAHGISVSLVVVARMVGMVVGLGLLTSVGLHRYVDTVRALPLDTVRALPDQSDLAALVDAALVQVQTMLTGGAVAALVAALLAVVGLRSPLTESDMAGKDAPTTG